MDDNELLGLFQELDTSRKETQYLRAPFGYIGGKSRSLKHILPMLPYRKSYVEPFGGSGAVLIAREPCDLEIYNDRYGGVVAFYRCIRDKSKCEQLMRRLDLTVHAREEWYWCRYNWKECQDDVERAARWYYMLQSSVANKGNCFGRSLNSKPQMGLKIHNGIKHFPLIHTRFKCVQVENLDWRDCIFDYDTVDTVYYMDPPYVCTTDPYESNFKKQDHIDLLDAIQDLKGFVALSGYDSKLYNSYQWDDKVQWDTFTGVDTLNVYKTAEKCTRTKETLWIKEAK